MFGPDRGPRLVLVLLVLLLVSVGTASAGPLHVSNDPAVHGTVAAQVDGTLDENTTVDENTTSDDSTTNETDDGGTLAVSTSLGGDDGIDTTVSVDESGIHADADASVNETTASVGLSAGTESTKLNATLDGEGGSVTIGDDTAESTTPVATTTPSARAGDSANSPTSSGVVSSTPTATASAGAGGPTSGDRSADGPTIPATPTAAGVLVLVGGAIVARKGTTVLTVGPGPAAVADVLAAGVDRLRVELPRLLAPFGYSRYDDSDPLEHEVRAELYDAVTTTPGVHLSGLERGVDVSLSSVRHHVRILEEESLVETRKIRGKRRYFPAGEVDPELVAALDDPATGSILRALAMVEPATTSGLADQLGRDPSTISHHLAGLEDDGLVERERAGQAVETRLSARSRRLLEIGESPGLLTSAD